MDFKIFIFLCLVKLTISARILIILPSPSLSHHLFYRPIIKELSLRGHEVISISPDPINDPTLTNLTEIDVHEETYGSLQVTRWLEESQTKPESHMKKLRAFAYQLQILAERIVTSPQVHLLIKNSNKHFDLLIIEMLIYPHLLALKEHFKCPMVGLVSLDTAINGLDAIGNPPDPNFYGSIFMKSGPNLSFWERLEILWHNIDFRIFYYWELLPTTKEFYKKHFNIENKSALEIEKSVDLILTNTNPIFHIPKPHVPAYIEIGGLQERERKSLPQDLKDYLDKSLEGVIYFSLGSNVKSKNLPASHRNSILNAFKQLPYKIIWKWENTTLSDKPPNVLMKQWLPQQDILDHPNLIAFVTQGGLQSIEEAIRGAVPMIGIPFGGDQEFNVQRIVDLGIGRQIQFNEISTELLVETIKDVASNPKYKENIKNVASLIWDQQTKPLDRAIWWIEYVIRHKGAKHLRSPAADLPWYKYLLLDIIGFIFSVLILILALVIYLVKFVLKIISFDKSKYKKE